MKSEVYYCYFVNFVCVHGCVCVCVCACNVVCVHVFDFDSVSVHTCQYLCVCVHASAHVCMWCMCVHVHAWDQMYFVKLHTGIINAGADDKFELIVNSYIVLEHLVFMCEP